MAKYVKIASALFETQAERDTKDAKKIVIGELNTLFQTLESYNLDLVVLSEGVAAYAQSTDEAESVSSPGDIMSVYMEFAVKEKCHIAGSIKLEENGKVYNSIVYIGPKGNILGAYHKVNLTIGAIERGHSSGTHAVIVDTEIGRLGGAICFDLNFEAIRKEYIALKPDIITFASMYHGGLMQALWAYQTRSFFVSALPFAGGGIIDPFGKALALTDCYSKIAMTTVNLDKAIVHLDCNREKFADIRRKYQNDIIIDIPPNIGAALIYSNSDKLSAMDVVKEFELELLDDYFDRSLEANAENR
jgi:predicted amidohydrolase